MDHGEGCWVTDVDRNQFLDFTAGIAVVTTGHSHPKVVAAIEEQARRFLHMSGTDFYYQSEIELAERLEAKILPGIPAKVFFTNSGAEAIEGAMKLARFTTGRPDVRCPLPDRLQGEPETALRSAAVVGFSRSFSIRGPRHHDRRVDRAHRR